MPPARFAVETENREAGRAVGGGCDARVQLADEAVLGAKDGCELHSIGMREDIDGSVAAGVDAGLIGD